MRSPSPKFDLGVIADDHPRHLPGKFLLQSFGALVLPTVMRLTQHRARQVIVIKKATNSEPGMFLNPRHFPHALDPDLLGSVAR